MHDGQQQQCFKEGAYVCLLKRLGIDNPRRIHTSLCATPAVENQQRAQRAWQTNLPQTPAALGAARLEKIVRVLHITQEAIARSPWKAQRGRSIQKAGHPNEQSGRVPSARQNFQGPVELAGISILSMQEKVSSRRVATCSSQAAWLSKGGGTIEYSVAYQERAASARRISEAMRFCGLDRQEGHPWLLSSQDCSALQVRSTCYYIPISLNRTPTNSGKPPLPFGLEKQAYRVLVAVIVRTSAFLEWQQSLC
jgi:hypothetical protein